MTAYATSPQQGSPLQSSDWATSSGPTTGENYQAMRDSTTRSYSGAASTPGGQQTTVYPGMATSGQAHYTSVTSYQGAPTVTTTTTDTVFANPPLYAGQSGVGQNVPYSSYAAGQTTSYTTNSGTVPREYMTYTTQGITGSESVEPSTYSTNAGGLASTTTPYHTYSTGALGTTESVINPSTYSTVHADGRALPYTTESFSQGSLNNGTTPSIYPITSTGSLSPLDYAIQNAINQGRVYAPAGGVYVPGSVALKSGMTTLYDSKIVPTFELPLSFQASITRNSRGVTGGSHVSRVTNKSNFVVAQKKRACC